MKRNINTSKTVTKDELKEEITALETWIDIKLDRLLIDIDDRVKKYSDKILTRFDLFAQEIELAREVREIATEETEKLKKRITKLEKTSQTA